MAAVRSYAPIVFDSGAGATVVPENLASAADVGTTRNLRFRTASGEKLGGGADCLVTGADDQGRRVSFRGARAPVASILMSAGECCRNGNMAILTGTGGWLIPGGTFQQEMKDLVRKHVQRGSRTTRLFLENGIFKMYLQLDGAPKVPLVNLPAADTRLCPLGDAEVPDFHRQPMEA